MPSSKDQIKMNNSNKWIIIVPIIVVLLIAAFFGYRFFSQWHREEVETAVKQEQQQWQKKEQKLVEKITDLEEELVHHKVEKVAPEKLVEVFGDAPVPEKERIRPGKKRCQDIEARITSFFSYLDKKAYVQNYQLDQGTQQEFNRAIAQLSAKPPMISGETHDLISLLHNISHFYRVLKKDRVNLTKDILKNEAAIIESVMESFYLWFTATDQCGPSGKEKPSLESLYQYSGFFLSTLGGRSYLSRRDSKVSVLTRYYAILILDRANDEKLNEDGIDIRPHLKYLYTDLRYQGRMSNRKHYLSTLKELMRKYRVPS
jgi:hypothetical protein